MKQERKLGRGLSALISENKVKQQNSLSKKNEELIELVSVIKIRAGVYQPRKTFNNEELCELAESIKENGLLQPIILRKADDEGNFEIIAGERRFRACKMAGLKEIPSVVKKINNHQALEIGIIENVQREDLSPVEEALGYKRLAEEFSYSQQQIAKKVGKSRSHVANILRILSLPEDVQEMLDDNSISMGHARAIIKSNNPENLAKNIIEKNLSVRDVEDMVRNEKAKKVRNVPALLMSNSKVKFINQDHIKDLEVKLSDLSDMKVKISYNSLKNKGKVTMQYDDFDKVQNLIKKLQK